MKKGIIKSINKENLQITIMGPIFKEKIRREKVLVFQNLVCRDFDEEEIESLKLKIFEHFRINYIGKNVEFTDYSLKKNDGVDIFYNGENISFEYVKKGWLRIETNIFKKSLYFDKLWEISQEAEEYKRGIFSKDLMYTPYLKKEEISNYFNKNLNGYITNITNNKKYKVFIIECNVEILVDFKYIETPYIENLENFIKFYSQNLFFRKFEFILLEKIDHYYLIKIIINDNFNLLKFLLNDGYSKLNEEECLNLIESNYIEKLLNITPNNTFKNILKNRKLINAKVVEIHSGHSISILMPNNQIKRVFFANVKGNNISKEELGSYEAKEFLRKLLIGKSVEVDFEFENKINKDSKNIHYEYVTLFLNGQNVSILILENGFADILYSKKYKINSKYISLYEKPAINSKKFNKGIFNQNLEKTNFLDLTFKENYHKIKNYFNENYLNNLKFGMVEYIISTEKIKIRIDDWKCYINLNLDYIISIPKDKKDEVVMIYYYKGLKFLKNILMQREVEFELLEIDEEYGMFFGNIYLNKENITNILLKNGFVYLNKNRNNIPNEYLKLEEEAKNQSKNIWRENFYFLKNENLENGKNIEKDHIEEKVNENNNNEELKINTDYEKKIEINNHEKIENNNYKKIENNNQLEEEDEIDNNVSKKIENDNQFENLDEIIEVFTTEFINSDLIFLSEKSKNQSKKIEKIIYNNKENLKTEENIKSKDLYLVLFNKQYHRGLILGNSKEKQKFNVRFIDYGFNISRKKKMIKSMIPEIKDIPYQSYNIKLAYLYCVKNNLNIENKLDDFIYEYLGNECFIKIEYIKNNEKYALFFKEKNKFELEDSLNYLIIKKGYGYLKDKKMENDPKWFKAAKEGLKNNPKWKNEKNYN